MPELILDIIEVASTGKRHIFGVEGHAECGQRYRITPRNKRYGGDAVTLTCEKCIGRLEKGEMDI